MILDIRFVNKSPIQIGGIRRISVYPLPLLRDTSLQVPSTIVTKEPELVLHFYYELQKPQVNIPLADIAEYWITND